MSSERAEVIEGEGGCIVENEREGLILNYRLGRKNQYPLECLIKVFGVEAVEAGQMVGWRVGWPANEPKIYGKIIGLHGRKGTLKVRFKRGVPGQALNSLVKIKKPI